jgi:hypothetical protein
MTILRGSFGCGGASRSRNGVTPPVTMVPGGAARPQGVCCRG